MRKICGVALLITFLNLQGVLAQESAFGLKGGLNVSTLNIGDVEATYNSKTGYHLGIFLREKFGKVALQPEVLLLAQKGEIKSTLFGTAQESFTYLSVPIVLKFYPVAGLNLQLGPQFAYLLDGERKYNSSLLGKAKEDIKDYYKNSDVSIVFGAGYDFGFGLGLDVRYNLGVQDINDVADGDEAKSRVILLSLNWNFLKN